MRQHRKLSRNGARNAAMCFLAVIGTSAALAADKDPAVPPGRDPGGVAIAIIGPGLDYTLPQISEHLARDGEGEIIGWDFVDNDRRPFEDLPREGGGRSSTTSLTTAETILDEVPHPRIIPVRVAGTDALQLGRAAAYVGQSPAKIALVLVASTRAEDWQFFRKAAEHFSDVLYIGISIEPPTEADMPIRNLDVDPNYPVSLGIDNLLGINWVDENGLPSQGSGYGPATIDVAVAGSLSSVAALAARVLAKEPELKGKALKARILSLATPLPQGAAPVSKHGWIEDPRKLYPAN